MSQNKTLPTDVPAEDFLATVEDPVKKQDAHTLIDLMSEATGARPVMWGPSIIGFGQHTYRYASGRTGEWFFVGFSPRKQDLTVYLMDGLDSHEANLETLGKFRRSKACLYIKKLANIDLEVLRKMVDQATAVGKTAAEDAHRC